MTHYEILGLRKTASTDEIKTAYKKLVKKYHPDVYAGDKTFAEKKIKEINEAYDVLSNPEQKKEYDESINPQPTTSYKPQDYSSYTYTSPNYNYSTTNYSYKTTSKRNAQARDSKYSYENYRKTYNSTNYGGYDYQKRYTDYHRSKTPNSNYSGNNPEQSTISKENAIKISSASKIFIVAFIIIFYFIFLITNIIQVSEQFGSNSNNDQEYTPSSQTDTSDDLNTTPKQSYEDYYNDKYYTGIPKDQTTTENEDKFDINTVYSDSELLEVYNAYFTDIYPTFREFKQAMSDFYYQTYYQDDF